MDPSQEYVKTYGIVLLPDARTMRAAIRLSTTAQGTVSDANEGFVLGKETNIPHISLYHLRMTQEQLARAKDALEMFRDDYMIKGSLGSVRARKKYLFWLTARTPELDRLQFVCVKVFDPLRTGPLHVTRILTPVETKVYLSYGDPYILDAFQPHITLTRLGKGLDEAMCGETLHRWRATHLAIAHIGSSGRVTEIVHSVPLIAD